MLDLLAEELPCQVDVIVCPFAVRFSGAGFSLVARDLGALDLSLSLWGGRSARLVCTVTMSRESASCQWAATASAIMVVTVK